MDPNWRADWVDQLSKSVREHQSSRRLWLATIPRYEFLERLGRGGMGAVYRAMDRVLSREVAVKVLIDPVGAPAEARSRFLQEARLAATLQHPNIVPIFDAGEHEGQVFLAMQLIDGSGLEGRKMELREAVSAMRDAARAVHFAHERGIIHRDLKPSNVMVDKTGRVYVTDFGLARRSDSAARMTLTGTIIGTPIYMPPEQARGTETDARSDVYSLGATLYELASGKPPFSGPNELAILKHVLLDEPPFPRTHAPALPQDLESVIVKAMDKKPTGRYATAAALADDLDRWLRSEPVEAPVRGTFYRVRKKIIRHRWRVLAIAATIGFAVSSAAFAWPYVRAVRTYRAAQRPENEARRRDLLQAAAPYYEPAATELAALDAEAVKKKREDQRLEDERRAAERKKDDQRREEERLQHENLQAIALLERDFLAAVGSDLPSAKRHLLRLREHNVKDIQQYEALFARAEFDEGLAQLQKLADAAAVGEFRALFTKLSGDGYRTQNNRDGRLIRPCLDLARKLDRPADQLDWLNQAERRGEKTASLYEQRGLINLGLDRFVEAWNDYLEYRRLAGETATPAAPYAELLFRQAGLARQEQRPQKALDLLDEALRIKADHPGALYLQSILRIQSGGSAPQALAAYKRVSQLDPTRTPAAEHVQAARKHLQDVAEKTWNAVDPAARQTERLDAVQLTEGILRSVSGDPAAPLLELAKMRRRLGQLKEALADARRASPSLETSLVKGQILYVQAQHDPGLLRDALDAVNDAGNADPKTARPWYWRGVIRKALNEPGYVGDLQQAVALGMKGPDLFARLAAAHLERKEDDQAIESAGAALAAATPGEDEFVAILGESGGEVPSQAANRLRVSALFCRGAAFYRKGQFESCRKDCSSILDADKTHSDARYHRGLALNGLQKYDAAIDDFTVLLTSNAKDYEALAARGLAYLGKGLDEEAKKDFVEALKHAPEHWKRRPELLKWAKN